MREGKEGERKQGERKGKTNIHTGHTQYMRNQNGFRLLKSNMEKLESNRAKL